MRCLCLLILLQLGCSATCLRDSDCQGVAVCQADRCVQLAHAAAEGGRAPASPPAPTPDTPPPTVPVDTTPEPLPTDAGHPGADAGGI